MLPFCTDANFFLTYTIMCTFGFKYSHVWWLEQHTIYNGGNTCLIFHLLYFSLPALWCDCAVKHHSCHDDFLFYSYCQCRKSGRWMVLWTCCPDHGGPNLPSDIMDLLGLALPPPFTLHSTPMLATVAPKQKSSPVALLQFCYGSDSLLNKCAACVCPCEESEWTAMNFKFSFVNGKYLIH